MRFDEIVDELKNINRTKDNDYAGSKTYSNLRQSEDIGIPAHIGTFLRLLDKVSRLKTFFSGTKLEVKDESIIDTLNDLANYAILTRILYEEKLSTDTAH